MAARWEACSNSNSICCVIPDGFGLEAFISDLKPFEGEPEAENELRKWL